MKSIRFSVLPVGARCTSSPSSKIIRSLTRSSATSSLPFKLSALLRLILPHQVFKSFKTFSFVNIFRFETLSIKGRTSSMAFRQSMCASFCTVRRTQLDSVISKPFDVEKDQARREVLGSGRLNCGNCRCLIYLL